MTDYEQDERRRFEATLNASFYFWSSLITVNGILLGVFVAVPTVWQSFPSVVSIAFVLASIVTFVMLIDNFLSVRNLYVFLGQMQSLPTEEERSQNLVDAESRFNRRYRNEKVVWVCLSLEGLTLLVAVVLNRLSLSF